MRLLCLYMFVLLLILANSEPQSSNKPLVFHNWPPKSKQINLLPHKPLNGKLSSTGAAAPSPSKQKGLLIQIRSDKRVPVMNLKRSPYHQTGLASAQIAVHRPPFIRPLKMSLIQQPHQHYLTKGAAVNPVFAKYVRQHPVNMLKLKLNSLNQKLMHGFGVSEKPYIYEKPSFSASPEKLQKLPFKNAVNFGHNHFVPIHTVPAPNLNSNENIVQLEIANNIQQNETPQPLYTLPPATHAAAHFAPQQYQVTEFDQTNDQTLVDPLSGKQKYFAPDPDPSLPTKKIRPATEPFNTPSNGHPLPVDVQNSYLPANKQAVVHFTNTPVVQTIPADSYAISLASNPHFQQFIQLQQTAPMAVYDPTYLVTQSRNLYQQYQKQKQQQLFHPSSITTYANTDMTQQVASDGQIIQSAKDFTNIIHPTFDPSSIIDVSTQNSPVFAALVQQQPYLNANALVNGGFVVSNYFNDNSQPHENNNQLAASYEEYLDLSERQRENDRILAQANLEIQKQLQQQLLEQDAPSTPPAASAYEEHQRLLQQQLGSTPLRIFVPDEEHAASEQKNYIYKRSEKRPTSSNNKDENTENSTDSIKKDKKEK